MIYSSMCGEQAAVAKEQPLKEIRTSIFQTSTDAVKVVPMRVSNWEITGLLLQS